VTCEQFRAKVPTPCGRRLGITHRVLDQAPAKPVLNGSGAIAAVGLRREVATDRMSKPDEQSSRGLGGWRLSGAYPP
jgi:hypothetical protein